jgi:hypothetical protein
VVHLFKARAARILLVVAVAAAVLPAVTPAASATTTVFGLPTPQCAEGSQPILPTAETTSPHGARYFTYKSGPGVLTAIVPPAGFNPLTADDATLSEMNFPVRPTDASALQDWTRDMGAYKGTDLPSLCLGDHLISSPQTTAASSRTADSSLGDGVFAHETSTNWSGYLYNGSFTSVVAHWTQNGAASCGCTSPQEGTWVGIGGSNASAGLVQDGTTDNGNAGNSAWDEIVSPCGKAGPYFQSGVSVDQDIAANTTMDSSGTTASFSMTANGTVVLSALYGFGQTGCVDEGTAEFINEAPNACGGQCPLTNYVETKWTNARVTSGGVQYGISNVVGVAVEMTNNGAFYTPPCSTSAHILAYPTSDGVTNGFANYWCHAS